MNKHKLVLSSLVVSLFMLLISCEKKIGKLPVETPPPPVGACDTITYTKHIKPIIEVNCVYCHKTPPSGGAPFPLETYQDLKIIADDGSLKSTAIDNVGKSMPFQLPPLPKAQKDLIMCWLSNGKKN